MKKFMLLVMGLAALSAALFGCGGGGGGDTATPTTPVTQTETPTATGTPVDLTAFKKVFYGKTSGAQYSFALTGSDSNGKSWSASYTVSGNGATTVTKWIGPQSQTETQNTTKVQTLVTLQQSGFTATSSIGAKYFNSGDETLYMVDAGNDKKFVPTSLYMPIPDHPTVGDFGTLTHLERYKSGPNVLMFDFTTIDVTWQLKPDVNGGSRLEISGITNASGLASTSSTTKEVDTFVLDANGIPTKLLISVITGGTTITLSGNKN